MFRVETIVKLTLPDAAGAGLFFFPRWARASWAAPLALAALYQTIELDSEPERVNSVRNCGVLGGE